MGSIADDYSIIFERHTGKQCYKSGWYSGEFVNAICKQHQDMKAQLAELQGPQTTTRDVVDVALVEANAVAMLADIKQILTGDKSTNVNL